MRYPGVVAFVYSEEQRFPGSAAVPAAGLRVSRRSKIVGIAEPCPASIFDRRGMQRKLILRVMANARSFRLGLCAALTMLSFSAAGDMFDEWQQPFPTPGGKTIVRFL